MDSSKLERLLEQQLKLMELFAERKPSVSQGNSAAQPSVDATANSIVEFSYDAEANVTFEAWFRRYEDLFNVDFATQDDAWKVRLLLRKLGPSEHDKYCNYILPQNPRDRSFKETVQTLEQLFGDHSSLFNTRYRCLNLVMHESDNFMTHLGKVNRECERFRLQTLTVEQFKSLILISSLSSPRFTDIRTRLLNRLEQDPSLTLQAIGEEYQRLTNLQRDSALVQLGDNHKTVQSIHQKNSRNGSVESVKRRSNSKVPQYKKPPSACWLCGAWHFVQFCPFKNHRCGQCKTIGHKEGFCQSSNRRTKSKPSTKPKPRRMSLSVFTKPQVNQVNHRKFTTVKINDQPVRLQLDTASDITIISQKVWHKLGSPNLKPTCQKATSACGGTVKLTGQLRCRIQFRDKICNATCYVSTTNLNLLGLDWIDQLGLGQLPINSICNRITPVDTPCESNEIISQHSEVFKDELGKFNKAQAVLHLREDTKPVFRPKRPVPYASLSKVEAELQRLQDQGVLVPVTYSSWAAPIVVVKKPNGSIRICADFSTGLNAALEDHHYPLPVADDLFTMLNNGSFFAKIDLADAYLQIEVAPESRELLTINTHKGLFQYQRLPFGVKTAPAIFQQLMDSILSGILGVAAYLDDILIVGRSKEELKNRIDQTLERIAESGLRLRPEKCQFYLRSIRYLGFIFDQAGRHPDPANIQSIQEMPVPKDISSLRSFLGLISYYGAFLPSLHTIRAPLNRLLQKDVKWNWSNECNQSFEKLKSMLTSNLLLTHYNPELPIIVAADASGYGLGAVILHKFPDGTEKAVMHASRSLTPAERKYGQIEKESLALVFAVKRFHKFIYGRRFTLLTDHKPLVSIFGSKKGIPAHSANRLQRWALILLGYDFDIQYRRTEEFGQADALSRLIPIGDSPEQETVIASLSMEQAIERQFTDAVRGLPVTAADIRSATQSDRNLLQAIEFTQDNWPQKVPEGELAQLFKRREALSVINECLMFNDRVVIPMSLRKRVLRQFHSGHPGTGRMKAIARSYAYWPCMDEEIEQYVKSCNQCQFAAKLPARAPPSPWPKPEKPWERIHIDFAGPINGKMYLVVVDAYSKWPEIFDLTSATSSTTVSVLNRLFSQHGLPETIVSDNGTQFTSDVFKEFCQRNNIIHLRSPPYHPQSNGQAERFVDTFKRALLKLRGEGTTGANLQKFLLTYRTTPNDTLPNQQTPAEALMGRKLRTQHHAMLPNMSKEAQVKPNPSCQSNFHKGAHVYVRDYRNNYPPWIAGIILRRRGNVMFDIQVDHEIWSRHRNQIRPRYPEEQTPIQVQLPQDILFETFNLPPIHQERIEPSEPARRIHRRTNRKSQPVRPMQIDPRKKVY